jgi:hypothetical protein
MTSQTRPSSDAKMTERFAIYYAPAAESALWLGAQAWLTQPNLQDLAVSTRRYGFHATLKAPMELTDGADRAQLEMALSDFAGKHQGVALSGLAPRLIDGFLALTTEPQPQAVTDFAATVVTDFEPYRLAMSEVDRARRLKAPLTDRQIALVDEYGYPYVLEQFQFHMTLTDHLPAERQVELQAEAQRWFDGALSAVTLDRLVLFHEAASGEPFMRLDDFVLRG